VVYEGGYPSGVIYEGAPAVVAPAHEGRQERREEERKEEKKPEKAPAPKEEKEANLPAPATLIVSLPAEAKLSVDGFVTRSTSAVRTFSSPALERGQDYVYTLTAEVVRDGKTLRASKDVTVRAGESLNVSLALPQDSVAQK
jgi:uncharacterized protein (TIGR03000 family)